MRDQAAPLTTHRPIGDEEVAALFAPFAGLMADGVVLAVSGGSDSMGLMHLVARWLQGAGQKGLVPPRVHIASVDHGLRAGAPLDTAFVKAAADALGLPFSGLRWEGAKPRSGLPDAAREARYGLLTQVLRDTGARLLMTAHTADDQAETLLMRLARGSGIDGLSGMAPLRPLAGLDGAQLARPLLGLEKARIAADLTARGLGWREDPTNVDPAYERPRVRAASATLAAIGLTPMALTLSARRLRRAAKALETAAREAFVPPLVRVDPCGLVQFHLPALRVIPAEIGLRNLRRGIEIAGGAAAPVSLASLEDLWADLEAGRAAAWTLSRAALQVKGDALFIEREPGRVPLPRVPLAADARFLWDGRFEIAVGRCGAALDVGPLGAEGLAALKAQGFPRPALPARTLRALPAIWQSNDLVAVPLLWAELTPMQLDVRTVLRGSTGLSAQAEAAS